MGTGTRLEGKHEMREAEPGHEGLLSHAYGSENERVDVRCCCYCYVQK